MKITYCRSYIRKLKGELIRTIREISLQLNKLGELEDDYYENGVHKEEAKELRTELNDSKKRLKVLEDAYPEEFI